MRTALRVLLARLRRRPLELEGPQRRRFWLHPDGTIVPAMAGGDKTPEEIAAEEETKRIGEEETDREREEEETREEEEANVPKPILEGDLDKERAERLIQNERDRAAKRLKKAQDDADAAKAEAAKLRQEKESEQEKVARELGEERTARERDRANAERLTIDAAIRDAAAEADVPGKTIRRLVRLVERDHISIDADDEVDGATEAVEAFLTEFPEFKGKPAAEPNDGDPPSEPPGGAPDRKRKAPKEITRAQVEKLAKEDPEKFNEMYDAGLIPASALGGSSKK